MRSISLIVLFLLLISGCTVQSESLRTTCLALANGGSAHVPACDSPASCLQAVHRNFSLNSSALSSPVSASLNEFYLSLASGWYHFNQAQGVLVQIQSACTQKDLDVSRLVSQVNTLKVHFSELMQSVDASNRQALLTLTVLESEMAAQELERVPRTRAAQLLSVLSDNVNKAAHPELLTRPDSFMVHYLQKTTEFNEWIQMDGLSAVEKEELWVGAQLEAFWPALSKELRIDKLVLPIISKKAIEGVSYLLSIPNAQESLALLSKLNAAQLASRLDGFIGTDQSLATEFFLLVSRTADSLTEIEKEIQQASADSGSQMQKAGEQLDSLSDSADAQALKEKYLQLQEEWNQLSYSMEPAGRRLLAVQTLQQQALELLSQSSALAEKERDEVSLSCQARAKAGQELLLTIPSNGLSPTLSAITARIRELSAAILNASVPPSRSCTQLEEEIRRLSEGLNNPPRLEQQTHAELEACTQSVQSLVHAAPTAAYFASSFLQLEGEADSMQALYECRALSDSIQNALLHSPAYQEFEEKMSQLRQMLRNLGPTGISSAKLRPLENGFSELETYSVFPAGLQAFDENPARALERLHTLAQEIRAEWHTQFTELIQRTARTEILYAQSLPVANTPSKTQIRFTLFNPFGEFSEPFTLEFPLRLENPGIHFSPQPVRLQPEPERIVLSFETLPSGTTILTLLATITSALTEENLELLSVNETSAAFRQTVRVTPQLPAQLLRITSHLPLSSFENLLVLFREQSIPFQWNQQDVSFSIPSIQKTENVRIYFSVPNPVGISFDSPDSNSSPGIWRMEGRAQNRLPVPLSEIKITPPIPFSPALERLDAFVDGEPQNLLRGETIQPLTLHDLAPGQSRTFRIEFRQTDENAYWTETFRLLEE
ncbi:MAG: hypothetical protein HY917_01745, partial [Candidatus Diapherotrites archaeon]|nr:hypothetical protein [Candidatus Diapherotrites archaeon]